AYRDKATGSIRNQVDQIILEIVKLTSLDETALAGLVAGLQDEKIRSHVQSLMPDAKKDDPVEEIRGLADVMVYARDTVTARTAPPAEQRKLVDLAIGAAQVIQSRGSKLLESGTGLDVLETLKLLGALTDGGYGAGLLNARERQAADDAIAKLAKMSSPTRDEFTRTLVRAERVVEWAQGNTELAFAEVSAPWTFLLPQV